jgi:hypothetical protein
MNTIYLENKKENVFIKNLIENKQNFDLQLTNYSTSIILNNKRFIFTNSVMSKKAFISFSKIKSDINKNNFVFPDKLKTKIFYYSANEKLKNKKFGAYSGVVNIDINSAYLTVLKNNGIIKKETFEYIQKTSKSDRLKSVGMLATQKICYEFKNGKETNVFLKSNENLRNIFFLCCYEIDQILQKIETILGKSFLFFWFDGIYFQGNNDKIKKIQELIKNEGFDSKIEFFEWLDYNVNDENINLCLKKGNKNKKFIIPLKKERKKIF